MHNVKYGRALVALALSCLAYTVPAAAGPSDYVVTPNVA
jgi:hypothetical protein